MSANLLIDGPGRWAYHVHLSAGSRVNIGRGTDNQISLPDSKASTKHAVIYQEGDHWIVRDLQSSNGTLLNGKKVKEVGLKNGDVLKIGDSDLVFQEKAHISDDMWGKTQMKLSKAETRLRDVIVRAETAEETVSIPNLRVLEGSDPIPPMRPQDLITSSFSFDDHPIFDLTESEKAAQMQQDMLWVANQLANLLGVLATTRFNKQEAYRTVMEKLRVAIDADNGFLMIPNVESKRWVIRSWVGDEKSWTTYEKDHPVPLTVANKAFQDGKVVSNALDTGKRETIDSLSIKKLKVSSYVALPLFRETEKAGLLYFDTRRPTKLFGPRDVMLLERMGNYILEIEAETR